MKCRSAQMRDAGLEGVETIVQGKQSVASEGHHNSLFSLSQNGRTGLLWPRFLIFNRCSLTPFADCLGVYPELAAQLREHSSLPSNQWQAGFRLAIIRARPRTDGGQALIIAALTAYVVVALP